MQFWSVIPITPVSIRSGKETTKSPPKRGTGTDQCYIPSFPLLRAAATSSVP
jgi:hypothetical protein